MPSLYPVSRSFLLLPTSAVAAPKFAGLKVTLQSKFTKCSTPTSWEFKSHNPTPTPKAFIYFLWISKTYSFPWNSACSAGYFWALRWIVMQMSLIFLGFSFSCEFQWVTSPHGIKALLTEEYSPFPGQMCSVVELSLDGICLNKSAWCHILKNRFMKWRGDLGRIHMGSGSGSRYREWKLGPPYWGPGARTECI